MKNLRLKIKSGTIIFLLLSAFGATLYAQTNEEKLAEANKIYAEANTLFKQNTAEAYREAREKFQAAARMFAEAGEKKNRAASYAMIGLISEKVNENRDALENYNIALVLYRESGDISSEGLTNINIALVYNSLENYPKALEFFLHSLPLTKQSGVKEFEMLSFRGIASTYFKLGKRAEALDYYTQSLTLIRQLGDKRDETTILNNIGRLYAELEQDRKAVEFYNQALIAAQGINEINTEAMILGNLGTAYSNLDEKQKALEFYEKSLSLSKQSGDKSGEAQMLSNIGKIYTDLRENQKSFEFFNRALQIRKEIGDKAGEASTLNNIAAAFDNQSEWGKALEFYNRALAICREIGNKRGESLILVNIGVLYDSLGDTEKSLEFYNQALPLKKELGDVGGQAAIFSNIGKAYVNLSQNGSNKDLMQKALELYNQALTLFRQVGDRNGEVTVLSNIGLAYYELGQKPKALEIYNQALPLSKIINSKINEARLLSNIGSVYLDDNEKRKAVEFFNQSLLLVRQLGEKNLEAQILNNMMFAWRDLGNRKFAVFYGKQSINTFEAIRSNNRGLDKNTQQNYLRLITTFYRALAEILIADGRLSEAQQILNLFKDQQFFDFNRNQNDPPKQPVKTPREAELSARYEDLINLFTQKNLLLEELKRNISNRQPTAEENRQKQILETEIKSAGDEFLSVLNKYEADFSKPDDAKDKVAAVPDTVDMQKNLRTLNQQTGNKTVAVYTLVGVKVFRALIITPDGIKTVSSPVGFDDLVAKSSRLFQVLQSDRYDPHQPGKEIYDVVFKPLEAELPKDTTTIMWSLDSVLRYLPPAAFFDGKQFLVERYNHVVFTRPDAERMTRNVQPNWTALGLGSSEAHTVNLLGEKISFNALPGTTEELNKILKQPSDPTGIFNGQLLEDKQFTKQAMFAALAQKRPLVHIASHFALRPGDESRSFLLLGDGSALTLEEMKRQPDLFSGVDLLTLSACNTATSASSGGREVDGFAELAQRLGAGAVIASLWSVADESTALLMSNFYRLKNEKPTTTKAEAMRQAQLAMLGGETKASGNKTNRSDLAGDTGGNKENFKIFERDEKKPFAHPYYWSPFVLIGNWK